MILGIRHRSSMVNCFKIQKRRNRAEVSPFGDCGPRDFAELTSPCEETAADACGEIGRGTCANATRRAMRRSALREVAEVLSPRAHPTRMRTRRGASAHDLAFGRAPASRGRVALGPIAPHPWPLSERCRLASFVQAIESTALTADEEPSADRLPPRARCKTGKVVGGAIERSRGQPANRVAVRRRHASHSRRAGRWSQCALSSVTSVEGRTWTRAGLTASGSTTDAAGSSVLVPASAADAARRTALTGA